MELNGVNFDTYFNNYPNKDGYFGKYGGVYVCILFNLSVEKVYCRASQNKKRISGQTHSRVAS